MSTPLRKIRLFKKISLANLAIAVDSDTGNLSKIETGKQGAAKNMAAKLATFYDHKITELHILYPERYPNWAPNEESSLCGIASVTLSDNRVKMSIKKA